MLGYLSVFVWGVTWVQVSADVRVCVPFPGHSRTISRLYDPTLWQLKLQCCQAVNCGSNKLGWLGSNIIKIQLCSLASRQGKRSGNVMLCVQINVSCLFLTHCMSVQICLMICDASSFMCWPLLHFWWPWANWRASLVAAIGRYRTWSVLSCAISWQGTVDNLFQSPVTLSPSPSPFVQDRGEWHEKSTLQTNNTITATPPFLSPLHSTHKLFWDKGSPWTPLFCEEGGLECAKQTYTKKGGYNTYHDCSGQFRHCHCNPTSALSRQNDNKLEYKLSGIKGLTSRYSFLVLYTTKHTDKDRTEDGRPNSYSRKKKTPWDKQERK